MRRLAFLAGLLVLLLATACDSGPVVVVATPLPPDTNFRTYQHPSTVFSIRLPSDWAVRDVSLEGLVRTEFSPPASTGLPLTVYALNTGAAISTAGLLDAIDRYQQVINGDPAKYAELSRSAQGDGSWRIAGVRQTPIGSRQINTFLQASGAFLVALETDITDLSEGQLGTLRTVINTLRVNPAAAIATGDLQVALEQAASSSDTTGDLYFSALFAWVNPSGQFIINGQVTNQGNQALEAIRVNALLYDAANTLLAEQANIVPVEALLPGQTTPFTVRFRAGKPPQTFRYELNAAARNAEFSLNNRLADDQFIHGNEVATYNTNNFLVVSGDIVNRTQIPAYFVKAIVAVYDEQGRVVATDSAFLAKSTLLPGEVSRFEVTFPELGGSVIRYSVIIEGKKQ
jgi:hypothetical protein